MTNSNVADGGVAEDEVRTLVSGLNIYWDRSKTLNALNDLLRPKNIALNVSGLIGLLDKIDDTSQSRKDNKTEKFVERFADLIASVMLNPPTTFRELYGRKEDSTSAVMCYIDKVTGSTVQTVFDTDECKRLALHSVYIKLWGELGRKPSHKDVNQSKLTPSMCTYYARFAGPDSIATMLEKYGSPY